MSESTWRRRGRIWTTGRYRYATCRPELGNSAVIFSSSRQCTSSGVAGHASWSWDWRGNRYARSAPNLKPSCHHDILIDLYQIGWAIFLDYSSQLTDHYSSCKIVPFLSSTVLKIWDLSWSDSTYWVLTTIASSVYSSWIPLSILDMPWFQYRYNLSRGRPIPLPARTHLTFLASIPWQIYDVVRDYLFHFSLSYTRFGQQWATSVSVCPLNFHSCQVPCHSSALRLFSSAGFSKQPKWYQSWALVSPRLATTKSR